MNGVIIDDEHIHELAFQKVLKEYGVELSHEKYLKLFAGRTDYDGFLETEKLYGVQLPVQKLLTEKAREYLSLFPENKKSFPGVLELIQRLSGKFTLALTSSSTREEVELVMNTFSIKKYFAVTISGDDVKKGKPDPEPYLLTSGKLNIETQDCVAIEDSASGVLSAKNAGMYCIAVTTTHSEKDLVKADVVVSDFNQINGDLISKFGDFFLKLSP